MFKSYQPYLQNICRTLYKTLCPVARWIRVHIVNTLTRNLAPFTKGHSFSGELGKEHHAKGSAGAETPGRRDRDGSDGRQDRNGRNRRHQAKHSGPHKKRQGRGRSACTEIDFRGTQQDREEGRSGPVGLMHDSRLIANKLIQKAAENGNTFTPMQLLKLVYIAHGWMLGLYGIPLIRDRIEAWKFGPVIPRLYHEIKRFGGGPVPDNLAHNENAHLALVEENLIEQIYDIYGKRSGIALSKLTHKFNTPWDRVYDAYNINISIPNDIIEEHYKALSAS